MSISKALTVGLFILSLPVLTVAGPPLLETTPYWSTSEVDVNGTGMIWRDCNNDGWIDVFYSNGNDIVKAANTIYLSDEGVLPSSASWSSANLEYSGHNAVGDIDDDGLPDFIVANFIGDGFSTANISDLYVNQLGLPATSPSWRTPDSLYAFSCALGDYDNDGDLDLAFATGEGYYGHLQRDVIYRNDNGTFTGAPVWQSSANTSALDVTWGDVDKDGDLDLAFCYDNRATSVYRNNGGTIGTSPYWQSSTVESGNTLVFGDVNGDSWLDLIVAYNNQLGGTGRFKVYFNDGAGHLNSTAGWQSATGGYGSAVALFDYDDDGDEDLAAGRWFTPFYVYENTGTTFTTTPVWTSDVSLVAEELAWVDINSAGVRSYADTLPGNGAAHLFYVTRTPLYAIDSVVADGVRLDNVDFCYDLISGWVSTSLAPVTDIAIYYRFSRFCDLTVSCWDTYNMAFYNLGKPRAMFTQDIEIGPAPLTVQFTDNSTGAESWLWKFGDGDSSVVQNPVHEYPAGFFDVRLTIGTEIGDISTEMPGAISAYADTLEVAQVNGSPGQSVRVDINGKNYLPIGEMTIPFTYGVGPLELVYDSFSTAGLRTDYFAQKAQLNFDVVGKRATIFLRAQNQEQLPPGDAPVVSLWFTVSGSEGEAPITVAPYAAWAPEFVTTAGSYEPSSINGAVTVGGTCCIPPSVGDLDQSGQMPPGRNVDGIDLSMMLDMLFISLQPVSCLVEADIDFSGQPQPEPDDINGIDLSQMLDHLFISLDPLSPCP